MRRLSVEGKRALAMMLTLGASSALIMGLATYKAPNYEESETVTGTYEYFPDGEGYVTADNGETYSVGEYDVTGDDVPCVVTVKNGKVSNIMFQATRLPDKSEREENGAIRTDDDGKGTILTDDGNVWVVRNPSVRNGNVSVRFDTNGTEDVDDDEIVAIAER